MSSAICFNLDQFKIMSSSNGLMQARGLEPIYGCDTFKTLLPLAYIDKVKVIFE